MQKTPLSRSYLSGADLSQLSHVEIQNVQNQSFRYMIGVLQNLICEDL